MVDVLILYEHKAREIENCALLSVELERRGYKVKVESIYSPFKYFINPKVVITPHLYNEQQLIGFCKNIWMNNNCIIELQYEQMLAKNTLIDDIHNPKGQAKFAEHIAWGEAQAERYLKCGIAPQYIHKVGSISMDLLRDEFNDYYLSKKEIGKKYGIDESKQWILFVSTFCLINYSNEEIEKYQKDDPNTILFAELGKKSYYVVMKWLEEACKANPDKYFIYRPHPIERPDPLLKSMVQSLPNFKCIGDMTMRQWAKVSDKIYNWYSTSMSDILFVGKSCGLLRPVPIPEELDLDIFDDLHRITTKAEFLESVDNMSPPPEAVIKNLEYNFCNGKGRMAYLQIVDLCESFIRGEKDGYNFDYGKSVFNLKNSSNLTQMVKEYMYIPFWSFVNLFKIENVPCLPERWNSLLKLFKKDVYGISRDLQDYKKRFESIL